MSKRNNTDYKEIVEELAQEKKAVVKTELEKLDLETIEHGFIFKDITGSTSIPEDCKSAWETVVKSKEKQGITIEVKGELYGENIVPMRNNVFKNDFYPSDIEKYFK